MKAYRHFMTITKHRFLVMKHCFCVGLYWQGLVHDLSKYSPTEFMVGAKYYQGDRSPNDIERRTNGYSAAWLHHKGRNKHHSEYWIDYSMVPGEQVTGMEMPTKYVVEMFCDRIAACKTYGGASYTDQDPWEYYRARTGKLVIHEHTKALLEEMLFMLAKEGQAKTFAYIKENIL